jgi:hypothetical protein
MSQRLVINGALPGWGGKIVLNADQIQYVQADFGSGQVLVYMVSTPQIAGGGNKILTIVTNSGTEADSAKLRDGINAALTSNPGGRVVEVANDFGGIDSVTWTAPLT